MALEDVLGPSSIVRQFFMWGVAYELVRNLMGPFFQAEANKINQLHPEIPLDATMLGHLVLLGKLDRAAAESEAAKTGIASADFGRILDNFEVPLSPADLADMVIRGWVTQEDGAAQAAHSGLTSDRFDLLVKDTGEPIGLETGLEAYRRGFIPWDGPPGTPSMAELVRTSRIRNEWLDPIKKLNIVPIPLAEVVDAVVENQITREQGYELAYINGIDQPSFDILFNTRGNPVPPSEAMELVRRGFIDIKGTGPHVTTFEQAIFEGATKDKWEPLLEKLIVAIPSAFQVIALANAGVMPKDLEGQILTDIGYAPDVVAAFLDHNSSVKVAGSKALAASTIQQMYRDQAVDNPTATSLLGDLGYSAEDAGFILAVEDMAREYANVQAAITHIRSLVVAGKVSRNDALGALGTLKVPAAQASALLDIWTLEQATNVKLLTEAQVVDAWAAELVATEDAAAYLEALGYSAFDAWVLLSLKNKAAVGPAPPVDIHPGGV